MAGGGGLGIENKYGIGDIGTDACLCSAPLPCPLASCPYAGLLALMQATGHQLSQGRAVRRAGKAQHRQGVALPVRMLQQQGLAEDIAQVKWLSVHRGAPHEISLPRDYHCNRMLHTAWCCTLLDVT